MKKFFKGIILGLVAAVTMVTLASCSSVSKSYADKITKAAEKKEYVLVEDAKKSLGDECLDFTVTLLGSTNGALAGIKGIKSKEDWQKKTSEADENTKYQAIIIVVLNNNCVSASYGELTAAEIQSSITRNSK